MPHPHDAEMNWGPDPDDIADGDLYYKIEQKHDGFFYGKNGITYEHGPFDSLDDARDDVVREYEAQMQDRFAEYWRADV